MAGRRRPWPCSKSARPVILSRFQVLSVHRLTSGATSDQTTRWRALATSGPTSPNRRAQGGTRLITSPSACKARPHQEGPCLARRTGGAVTSCCVFPPAVASTGRVRFPSENASRTKSKMGYADPMYVEIGEENDDSFVWAQPNDFSRHLSDQALCLIILAYGNERNFS
jgi:hypothetical protein